MFEETRDDVCIVCLLLKISDIIEVGAVFSLVGCSGERDIHMFASNPLIKVIFNLNKMISNKILK